MAADGKSLTEPPKNLKEAIDWVIQIKKDDVINDIAKALQELLKEDGSEVAMNVLKNYRHVSESVIKGLDAANENLENIKKFNFTYTALNKLSQGLKPFVTGSQANISANAVDNVGAWVSKVQENSLKNIIPTLATGLETFKKGILQNSNDSTYKSDAEWSSLTPNDKRDCAVILLGIMPVVYIGLTYFYWQCEGTGGWPDQSLSGSSGDHGNLKNFMAALGYQSNQLANKNGSTIVSSIMNSMFSNELRTAYGPSQTHYFNFLKALQDKAPQSLVSSVASSPLTSLYLISYYYITNFLYDVRSTSPATPSFAGYSGLAALGAGAYGFNLGGLGSFISALLA
ncbi:variant erythrocyte surface antigen-1 family protein [Babesia caballi]|uniref:Variant erythrocyte surface antigen-1 family protein n=1 Tax=Babesia caballi TaxID=5871 RepID=A0AAV4LT19_BABCB|nr:variant erythrocyte surface antigen-1 family protein [Babesia caballi]